MTITPVGHTLGYLIGLPVTIVLLSVFFLIMAGGIAYRVMGAGEDAYYGPDYFGAYAVIVVGIAGLLVTSIISLVAFWPLDGTYHERYRVTGQVTAVGHRLISDSNHYVNDRYVFTIGGQPFGVDDTRASITKVGDTVTLVCTKEYTYGAAYGWACNWGSNP